MKRLFSTEMDLGRGSLDFLGNCIVAGRACYFVRLGERDVLLVAELRSDSSGRTFARGEHLCFEYRSVGPAPLSALATTVLERFTLRLLRQEARIADTLRETQDGTEGMAGITVSGVAQDGDGERFDLQVGDDGRKVTVSVGSPGCHPLPLFRWTFRVTTDEAAPPHILGAIQHFLLLYCAHRVLEKPFQAAAAGPDLGSTEPGREVFAYHAPARKDHADGAIPELQAGDRLRLSFEVPTRCSQRCVFCVAWKECGRDEEVLTQEQLLAAASRLLSDLSNAPDAVKADVVLVGQDALTHQGFPELVRLFRTNARVSRITVVTPGTDLARAGLSDELSEAGLDCVVLTLLAADAMEHDRLAGRDGAQTDFNLATRSLTAAGLDWELNTVVLRANQDSFPALLEHAADLGRRVRVYLYTSEPMVSPEQVSQCTPDIVAFAALLERHRALVEDQVESLHYAPLCLLPKWIWRLAGHASQSLPNPATPLPEACQGCAALGARCPSVSASYVSLFGTDGLRRLEHLDDIASE